MIISARNRSKEQGQFKVQFLDCVDNIAGFQIKMHPSLDLAAIRFDGWNKLMYKSHAIFGSDLPKPGRTLCRLGFPFPEFSNYQYNEVLDDIAWTDGNRNAPRFPLDGMLTRLIGVNGRIAGFELSTPGYVGMIGGPVFDASGLVYGMYTGDSKLKLGQCIHMDAIKEFLKKEDIPFDEYDGAKGLS